MNIGQHTTRSNNLAEAGPLSGKILIRQIRSTIGKHRRKHKEANIRGLGLRGPGSQIIRAYTPEVLGKIKKVEGLVKCWHLPTDGQPTRALVGIPMREVFRTVSGRSGPSAVPTARPPELLDKRGGTQEGKHLSLVAVQHRASLPLHETFLEIRRSLVNSALTSDAAGSLAAIRQASELLLGDQRIGDMVNKADVEKIKAQIQRRAVLRELMSQLFSEDKKIAKMAARAVAFSSPITQQRFRGMTLESGLTDAQQHDVAKAVAEVLSAAGDRCYTWLADVQAETTDDPGRCTLRGRLLVTKLVLATSDGFEISLPDDGDKERAVGAKVRILVHGSLDQPSIERMRGAELAPATLVDCRFSVDVRPEIVTDGPLQIGVLVPGVVSESFTVPLKSAVSLRD